MIYNWIFPEAEIRNATGPVIPETKERPSEFERVLLNDLELTQKYMQRVMGKSQDSRISSRAFHAQSHLLTAGILSRATAFFQTLRQLHDRNGQA